MYEIFTNEWVFVGLLLIAFGIIYKLMHSGPKMDKTLENQYKQLLSSEKYKVK